MSDRALSKAITEATQFLEQVHDNVQELLNELIGQMEPAGWRSVDGNRVSWDLSYKLDGGYWLIPCAALLFLPKANIESRKARRMIAVCCMFAPAEGTGHGYATLEASLVRFSKPTHADDVWDDDYSPLAYQACLGRSGAVELNDDQYRSAFPQADSVSTIILPLCEVTNADVLRTKVVAPLLALGAQA